MARAANKLTATAVQKLRHPGRYPDGAGLSLVISSSAKRSWAYRYQLNGRAREMTLGDAATTSLAEARHHAADARRLIDGGVDPLELRREEQRAEPPKAAVTFGEAARHYIAAHEVGWKNEKHRQQWRSTIATHCRIINDLPCDEVTTREVLEVLVPIWNSVPETASRLRGRIEQVLAYAAVQGWRSEEAANPAQWRGRLQLALPSPGKVRRVEHHAALPWKDMPAFYRDLAAREGMGAIALRFCVLTACRSGEARGATWAEIDLASALWVVPAGRMKAGKAHRVPLSGAACVLLAPLAELLGADSKARVFPGRDNRAPLSDMSLTAVLRRMGRGDLTAHGFRSTFRDWAAESTDTANHVVEQALAHVISNSVEAAYRRGDLFEKRRQLMTAWADFCTSQ